MKNLSIHSSSYKKIVAYFLRKIQTLRANNWRIRRIHNAKFSVYYFYINRNKYRDFQICVSVPVSWLCRKNLKRVNLNRVIVAKFKINSIRNDFDLLNTFT